MLEPPGIQNESIIACLQDEYGLHGVQVAFHPLGADRNSAVYRVITDEKRTYFVKLRRGIFNKIAVVLPKFLSDHGIPQIIAPLETQKGGLWSDLGAFKLILYPFFEGHNGFEAALADRHWVIFGRTLKKVHATDVPPALTRCIQQETYSPKWREIVKTFLAQVDNDTFNNPVAAKLAVFLKSKRDEILDLLERAERLALALKSRSPEFILCHSDCHAGNILIDDKDNLYIIDWDDPVFAPKERDLMFIGGGLGGCGHTPQEEESLFYQGYGPTQIDPIALAYYRYERIIQDIAVFCEGIFMTNEGGKDREQSLRYLKSNFLPNGTIEIAYKSDYLDAK